jgi:hypothetical protein
MIDSATGQIRLPLDRIQIGSSLTREQFLASPLAERCRELVCNEPYCSFALPTVQFNNHTFAWSLWFCGSVLQRVLIQCADVEFGSSWSDWSEEREKSRKQLHDSLIRSLLGQDFSWGSVYSDYDSKSGFSSIGVVYAAEQIVQSQTPPNLTA